MVKIQSIEEPIQAVSLGNDYANFESLTVSTTVLGLTKLSSAWNYIHVFITVETQAVRFRVDGGAPTSSVGHQLDAGDTLTLDNPTQLAKFRVIRKDAADATLRVSYGQ